MRISSLFGLVVQAGAFVLLSQLSSVFAGEGAPLELDNEIVCRVNTEAISKHDVEDRMEPPGIAQLLRSKKTEWEHNKMWTDENQKQWYDAYIPPFRDALRKVVRERLILQYATNEKITADEKEYQREYDERIKALRDAGYLGSKGFTPAEVAKAIRENLTIYTYEGKFSGVLEQPTRPEVQAYYKANIAKYQRKAGMMVRIIRIDRVVTNPLTKQQTVREDAYEHAQEILQNLRDYNADFKETARLKSDDVETRGRGGLLITDAQDPYFDIDSCNPLLAKAIKPLKAGEITGVFEYLDHSWAIAQVVDKREAGAEPLEGRLYDRIYKEMLKNKGLKNEDEWFKKALTTNLVQRVEKGVAVQMPVEFFFPDEGPKPTGDKSDKDKVGAK